MNGNVITIADDKVVVVSSVKVWAAIRNVKACVVHLLVGILFIDFGGVFPIFLFCL